MAHIVWDRYRAGSGAGSGAKSETKRGDIARGGPGDAVGIVGMGLRIWLGMRLGKG